MEPRPNRSSNLTPSPLEISWTPARLNSPLSSAVPLLCSSLSFVVQVEASGQPKARGAAPIIQEAPPFALVPAVPRMSEVLISRRLRATCTRQDMKSFVETKSKEVHVMTLPQAEKYNNSG